MEHEVIPVDFKHRQRMPSEWVSVFARLQPRPNATHEPGTLPEIGPAGTATWPEQLGLAEPAPALSREEMIVLAAQAIMTRFERTDEEAAQLMDEALLPLDEAEIAIAWRRAHDSI